MKFSNNNDGIKRVIGRNFSAQQDDDIQEQKDIQDLDESSNIQDKAVKRDSIPFYKKLNIIPFSIFLIFAAIVIWQRDSFVPNYPSYNYQNVTRPQETSTPSNVIPVQTQNIKTEETKKVEEVPKKTQTEPKPVQAVKTKTQTNAPKTTTKVATSTQTKPNTITEVKSKPIPKKTPNSKSDIEKSSDWFFE